MKLKKILKFILKNIGIFIVGGVIGIITAFLYTVYIWAPEQSSEIGLAIIALIIPIFILLGFLGLIFGGIFSLILFYLIKFLIKSFKHFKKQKN